MEEAYKKLQEDAKGLHDGMNYISLREMTDFERFIKLLSDFNICWEYGSEHESMKQIEIHINSYTIIVEFKGNRFPNDGKFKSIKVYG